MVIDGARRQTGTWPSEMEEPLSGSLTRRLGDERDHDVAGQSHRDTHDAHWACVRVATGRFD